MLLFIDIDSQVATAFAAGTIGAGLAIGGGALLGPPICTVGLFLSGFGAGGVAAGESSLIFLIQK